ncbi:MAG: 4a-hydroxytetrahydrobiopterin dehydratase [Anaerolineae bacterium]|nr:4a-hydroxytetrahydrobiopterin dehydratase [Anaerolineae bacterium]
MTITKATEAEIQQALAGLGSWAIADGKLHREFKFRDFVQAFGFMAQVALLAERTAHHPEWFNIYNRVVVDLTTHEVGEITRKDLDLAREMEEIAGQMSHQH